MHEKDFRLAKNKNPKSLPYLNLDQSPVCIVDSQVFNFSLRMKMDWTA